MQTQSPLPSPTSTLVGAIALHQRSQTSDRTIGHTTPPSPAVAAPQVIVAGVGPVYGHGLVSVLGSSGVPSRFVRELDELDTVAAGGPPCVVVVPQARSADALQVMERRPRRSMRLVLLLADVALASYLAGLRAGAMSVVPAAAQLTDVVAVVSAAADGYTVLPRDVVLDLCRPLVTGADLEVPLRERQWLRQIAEGVTIAQLASRSAYSEREMYRQLGAVYRRLGATNRTGALLKAQRSGLLDS